MPTTLPSTVHELVERYTAAEAAQDAATLADLATDERLRSAHLSGPLPGTAP